MNISELGVALICANLPVAYALLAESFKRWSKSMTSSRGYIATDPAGTGPANNSRSKASRPRSPTVNRRPLISPLSSDADVANIHQQENLSQRGRKLPSAEKIRLSPVVHSYSRQDEDNWAEDHPNHIKVDREFRVSNV